MQNVMYFKKPLKRVFVKEQKKPKASEKILRANTNFGVDYAILDLHNKATEAGWQDWNLLFTSQREYIYAKRTK